MKCKACGAELKASAKFCDECGTEVVKNKGKKSGETKGSDLFIQELIQNVLPVTPMVSIVGSTNIPC